MPHTNRKPGYRARKESAASRQAEEAPQRNRAASAASRPSEKISRRDRAVSNSSSQKDKILPRTRAGTTTSRANDQVSNKEQAASNILPANDEIQQRARSTSIALRQSNDVSNIHRSFPTTSGPTEDITQKNRNISTNSRPTPPKSSLHGAGTSASWSSANNTNNARFERLDKMAGHSGLNNSPFMPKSTIELLRHEKEFTHDRAQEQVRALKNMIMSSEAAKRTGHTVRPFIGGKKMPAMGRIWELGAEQKTKVAWPSQAEYKRYGDSAANSTFKLPRHLPPPRNKYITKTQVRLLINSGMNDKLAMSLLGKDSQGGLEGLQWDDMSVLEAYKMDEQWIIEEAKNIVGSAFGMYQGEREVWESEGFASQEEEFSEGAVRTKGTWGELLDEVSGIRLEFAERI